MAPGYFDCIVCADVLEHLMDPERTLAALLPALAPGGAIVASIPNVRHQDVLLDLLIHGRWQYQWAGILDATHLRFFTLAEIAGLLDRLGLRAEELVPVGSPEDPRLPAVAEVVERLGGDRPRFERESRVIQYVLRARPIEGTGSRAVATSEGAGSRAVATPAPAADRARRPKASIVVLAWNQLAYTRECVASVQRCTREPYELILVDNGSTDGTLEFFRSVPGATVVANGANLGFAAGNNRGLDVATGDFVCILNNDTLVTDGWLDGMIACAEEDPRIGIVGPMSNCVSGPQQIDGAVYDSFEALQRYAADFRGRRRGQRMTLDRIVGFCMLITRAALDRIGRLDENFGVGNFEDDDYCLRARRAGFRLMVAADVFIHHFGSRTFVGEGVDWHAAMKHGETVFREKWSGRVHITEPAALGGPGDGR
ncbi:MAG: glycosyltransferase [Candidatus Rokubacteria bacterium]|nr:glycosyltransferase [Candidatus Rokubacteria bacterium]